MKVEELLEQLKNLDHSYELQNKFLNEQAQLAAEFLFTQIPALQEHIDTESLSSQLLHRRVLQSTIDFIQNNSSPGDADASRFSILTEQRNPVNFISVFRNFLTRTNVEKILNRLNESQYWVNNYLLDLLKDKRLSDPSWLKDYFTIGFGNEADSKKAFEDVFGTCTNEFTYDDDIYTEIVKRIRQATTGHQATAFFNPEYIQALGQNERELYFNQICQSEQKADDWLTLSQGLKPFGVHITRLPRQSSEESLAWLKEELAKTKDVKWIIRLTEDLRHYSCIKYLELVEEAILNNVDNIDFSQFGRELCCRLKSPALIEKIFDQCKPEGQKELARPYGWHFIHSKSIDDVDWDLVERFPDLMAQSWFKHETNFNNIERLKWFWHIVKQHESKQCLLRTLFYQICSAEEKKAVELGDLYREWYQQDPKNHDNSNSVGLYLDEENCEKAAFLLWDVFGQNIRTAYVEHANEDFDRLPQKGDILESLLTKIVAHDLELAIYYDSNQYGMLRYLSNESFAQLMPLSDKIEKSSAAVPYLAVGIAQIDCTSIGDSGLYTYTKKNIREAAQWSLILTQQSQAATHIKELLNNKKAKLDEAKCSHLLDKLEELGEYDSQLDPFCCNRDDIVSYCEKKLNATLTKKISRIWNDELKSLWGESSVVFSYALATLASDSWGRVPRFVRQCFELHSEAKRKQIAIAVIECWAMGEAHKSDFWVLKLLDVYSDENTVPLLQRLVVQWHKKFRVRAVAIVEALGRIDTAFSLSACDEFYKKSTYSSDIRHAAKQALKNAASRRGIGLSELYDELVPTFGLEEGGLTLDVGARTYIVKLQSTLALTVQDESSGRIYKSLPKAKNDEDSDLRIVAENQFKLLKKNIKPSIKALEQRFLEAFECGQVWKAERWKMLFLTHPILSLVAQGFIWTQKGQNQTFRISEDLSLIDFEDNEIELGDADILLMHPAEESQELIDQWKTHFDDYEITSFLPQITKVNLDDIDLNKEGISYFVKKTLPYGTFKRIMEKNNYQVGGGDGSWIAEYFRVYTNSRWLVCLQLEECRSYMSFDDDVQLGVIYFYHKKERKTLTDTPIRLIASVVQLMNQMVATK